MSRAGSPTDKGAMEAINGCCKEELSRYFKIETDDDATKAINHYFFYNGVILAFTLNYIATIQFKHMRLQKS